ncbi:MAG TPA: zinc dependent phospholipase C family protein [Bacteroidia bacterium]|nr:zinc dependent phospholipase C family protein [Bacteroidia bacterium]
MRKIIFLLFFSTLIFIVVSPNAFSWGFYGHRKIEEMAIYTLPPQMINFYKKNSAYIIKHSVDPDKRRYINKKEGPRHFIDIDHYGKHPFDSIPKSWKEAVNKYSEDTLDTYGIVPWYIDKMEYYLTLAFEEGDVKKILHLSADLGHYVADSHVPLHTTANYNGQFTHQIGIHSLWESAIPELYGDQYNYLVGRAKYLDYPLKTAWKAVKESYSEVDSVLTLEKELEKKIPADEQFTYNAKGKKKYSKEYIEAYSKSLNGMVERRLRASISDVGSYWYTAWVNAGQPDLDALLLKEQNNSITNDNENNVKIDTNVKPVGHED